MDTPATHTLLNIKKRTLDFKNAVTLEKLPRT